MRADSSKPVRLVVALVAGLLLAACGGDGGTTPNQSPTASISQPAGNATFEQGASVTFQGSGSDPEDGTLTGSSLSWTSSLDGPIGTGGSFTRSDLSVGQHTITLTVTDSDGATGTASRSITVEVPANQPTITAVSPDPLVAGSTGTITGTNFSTTASVNVVTVSGVQVQVTSATATSLNISIPAGACLLAGAVDVVVTVSGLSSSAFSHTFDPAGAAPLSLAVGQMELIQDPGSFCVRLQQSSSSERYLIGVQSTSPSVTRLDSVRLAGIAGPGNTAPPLAPLSASGTSSGAVDLAQLLGSPARRRMEAHRRAEARWRERERELRSTLLAGGLRPEAAPGPQTIPADLAVGDTIDVSVIDVEAANLCTGFTSIEAVVRVVGTRGVWLEDVDNPAGGYVDSDFQALSDALDTDIYVADSTYFGAPSDIDGNSRIAVLVTKEVNRSDLGGFVFNGDLFLTEDCAASNEGEIYYSLAPDPNGEFGDAVSDSAARANNKSILAHELVHLIQNGVRLDAPTFENALPLQTPWESEGQATLGEEVVGHSVTGRQPGQNYGFSVAFGAFGSDGIEWYIASWIDLALYYGTQFTAGGSPFQIPTAPHECSWLDRADPFGDNDSPCISDRAVYGVPWSLLRWLGDHYGPGYPGGEEALYTDMVASSSTGYAMLEDLVGVPFEEILAHWAASLYIDDRVTGADALLTIPSWNLVDIESGLIDEAHLNPMQQSFGDFSRLFQVRGGSSAYVVVSGSSRPDMVIRARTPDGSQLAGIMQVWVVRMQ